jgi:HAD superfamily hydrolase (TIGR01549 family)
MINEIQMITFDLDDTLWDNKPTITNAEIKTRKWIEEKVGAIEWGDLNDFLLLREALIRKDKSIAWDISKLRVEIFKEKIKGLVSNDEITKLAEEAFSYFLKKRHEIELFPGVEDALKALSENYMLGVLTNGNADIYKLSIGKYFEFSISSLEAQNSKPNKSHFELAKSHLPNLKYSEMLHIGDHQINDIFGAHALGMEVLWFNNTKAFWEQNFEKPDQFYDWHSLAKIIEEKYESR